MRRFCAVLALVTVCAGCQTLEERLAKRVGCDASTVKVTKQLHVPAYTQYNFNCENKKFTCRDAPFYSDCSEGESVDDKSPKK